MQVRIKQEIQDERRGFNKLWKMFKEMYIIYIRNDALSNRIITYILFVQK